MIAVGCLIQSFSVSLPGTDTVDFQTECLSRCCEMIKMNVDRLGEWGEKSIGVGETGSAPRVCGVHRGRKEGRQVS